MSKKASQSFKNIENGETMKKSQSMVNYDTDLYNMSCILILAKQY